MENEIVVKGIKEVQEKMIKQEVDKLTEEKGNFTYLSWANAWKLFIEIYPEAKYEVVMNTEKMIPIFGSKTAGWMVYTKVKVEGIERMMWLPVKDNRNSCILKPDMMQINTTIMRCLVKNLAMFGLGITVFGAEDIPEEPKNDEEKGKIEENKVHYITKDQWYVIEELGIECGGHKKKILEELGVESWNKVELASGLEYIKQCKEHLKIKKDE